MEKVITTRTMQPEVIKKPRLRIKYLKNKIVSILLLSCGIGTAALTYSFEGKADITVLIFVGIFAIPLFFAKQNYIVF